MVSTIRTFAPTAEINSIRIPISQAVNIDWKLQRYAIKTAFLHGGLEEEIYIQIPPGDKNFNNHMVCKLKKALYRLKQSPRAWFGRFTQATKVLRYEQCNGDYTLFF